MSGAHQSPAASAEPVRAWTTSDLRRRPGRAAVVAIGDGQLREDRPVVEVERPEVDALSSRPVPVAGTARRRPTGSRGRPTRHPAAPTRLAVGGGVGGRGLERLVEVGDEVVDVLQPDRQPDEVRRDAGRDLLLRLSCECVVEAGWMISDLASPTLASRLKILTLSMSRRPASTPPLTPNVTIPPKPPFR